MATLTAEISRADFAALTDAAEQFLWGGLSWERWAMLSEESRAAFVAAGKAVKRECARYIAEAIRERE